MIKQVVVDIKEYNIIPKDDERSFEMANKVR